MQIFASKRMIPGIDIFWGETQNIIRYGGSLSGIDEIRIDPRCLMP